jgi:Holliday junction DNA helicase RuvA
MIAHLNGIVDSIEDDYIILDVAGVGYQVFIGKVPDLSIGGQLKLFTIQQFKEDGVTLFGFATQTECKLMQTITSKVSGVGGKTALGILRNLSPGQIADAVIYEKPHIFQSVPGIGAKLSQRLCLELKDAMGQVQIQAKSLSVGGDMVDDARAALRALGFSMGEVERALSGLGKTEKSSEEIIKTALGKLSK